MLKTSWGQIAPYNAQCPVYCSWHHSSNCNLDRIGGRCPAGCVAIALSQVLAYYKMPRHLDWSSILVSPKINNASTAVKSSVAAFIREVGGRAGTKYECTGSGVDIEDTIDNMIYTFNSYGKSTVQEKKGFSFNLIMTDLRLNRPVILRAQKDGGGAGHVWVCDGWKRHDYGYGDYYEYLHMNWGWGGNSNGFFYMDDPVSFITWGTFDDLYKYSSGFEMLINI